MDSSALLDTKLVHTSEATNFGFLALDYHVTLTNPISGLFGERKPTQAPQIAYIYMLLSCHVPRDYARACAYVRYRRGWPGAVLYQYPQIDHGWQRLGSGWR